jgi:large subunit ribosomal protein L29
MKVRELRDMTREELLTRRNDFQDELFNLKMRRSLKNLDNPLRLRTVKRDIARINTVLREDDLKIRGLAESKKSILDDADRDKK